jgi:hypothetical protein
MHSSQLFTVAICPEVLLHNLRAFDNEGERYFVACGLI